nr:MAG: hypothetical protein [Molluscum contagiosum virus]
MSMVWCGEPSARRTEMRGMSSPKHTNSKLIFTVCRRRASSEISVTISVLFLLRLVRLLNSLKPSLRLTPPLFSVVWKLDSACCVNFSLSTCAEMMPMGSPPPRV